MNDASIAIATVTDRNFLPAACCQLVSTAGHLESDSGARLFLVVCEVAEGDFDKAERFFKNRGLSVEIVVPDFLDEVMALPKTRFGYPTYVRLYLDRIFDERWQRVVYFDADTRVCSPLSPLLEADLRGQPIGAVHDFIYYVTGHIHRRRRQLCLADEAPYFQSGVMLFDWQQMRACDGLGAARSFLSNNAEACREAADQDALNATFQNRWTPLDPRWNFHHLYLMYGGSLQPRIMHYTTTKPWSRARPRAWREAAAWYKSELADSPWPDFVEPQSRWQAMRADLKIARRRYRPHIREALANSLPFLVRQPKWKRQSEQKPWVPRRSQDVEDMAQALIMEAEGRCPPLRPPEAVLANGHW